MRRLVLLFSLLVALGLRPAVAEDFQEGVAAYESGDLERAEAIWKPLAEAGDPLALYALGKLYARGGEGVEADPARAAEWYRRAVEAGSADARNNLAMLLIEGRGVEKDVAAALELWKKAAAAGHPQAQYNLAMAHYRGLGGSRQLDKATEWFRRAADNRLPEAQFALAELHRVGVGVPRDGALALTWYERARAGGYAKAALRIAELTREEGGARPGDVLPPAQLVSDPGSETTVTDEASSASLAASTRAAALEELSPDEVITARVVRRPGQEEVAAKVDASMAEQSSSPSAASSPSRPGAPAKLDEVSDLQPIGSPDALPSEALLPEAIEEVEEPAEEEKSGSAEDQRSAEPVGTIGSPAVPLPKPAEEPDYPSVVAEEAASEEAGESPDRREAVFGIWLGSMVDQEGAERLWQEAYEAFPEELSDRDPLFVPVTVEGRPYLRVVADGFTRNQAQAACGRLQSRDSETFCNVVRTE